MTPEELENHNQDQLRQVEAYKELGIEAKPIVERYIVGLSLSQVQLAHVAEVKGISEKKLIADIESGKKEVEEVKAPAKAPAKKKAKAKVAAKPAEKKEEVKPEPVVEKEPEAKVEEKPIIIENQLNKE